MHVSNLVILLMRCTLWSRLTEDCHLADTRQSVSFDTAGEAGKARNTARKKV